MLAIVTCWKVRPAPLLSPSWSAIEPLTWPLPIGTAPAKSPVRLKVTWSNTESVISLVARMSSSMPLPTFCTVSWLTVALSNDAGVDMVPWITTPASDWPLRLTPLLSVTFSV